MEGEGMKKMKLNSNTKKGGPTSSRKSGTTRDNLDYSNRVETRLLTQSKKKISFAGPSITKKEIAYVVDGVKNGFYQTFDKHVKKLEQTTAAYTNSKYALAGFCATHCMHLACL